MSELDDKIGSRFEWMSREEIARWQAEALRRSVAQAAKSRWYSAKFKEWGVGPEDIRTAEDIARFPFTTKEDLRLSYPDGMVAVERERLIRLHTSDRKSTRLNSSHRT